MIGTDTPGSPEALSYQTDSKDTGSKDTSSKDTSSKDTSSKDTSSNDTPEALSRSGVSVPMCQQAYNKAERRVEV